MRSKLLKINKSKRSYELKIEISLLEYSWVDSVIANIKHHSKSPMEIIIEKVSFGKKNYYVYSTDSTLRVLSKALYYTDIFLAKGSILGY
jgi:hypothetical protein